MLSTSQIDVVCDVAHYVKHFLPLVKLQPLLGEIAETHSVANVETSAIHRLQSQEQLEERGLSRTVVAHDAHLLKTCEIVVKVLEQESFFCLHYLSILHCGKH